MRPLIIAHRGASARAPENTAAAFGAAIEDGADMVEFDVRWSADAEPVILHDATLERTTDGHGPLAALTLGDLRRLDAGAWFGKRFRAERVLTLREALAILGPRIRVNIELCADVAPPAGFESRLVRLVEDARLPEDPLYSSFDFSLLTTLRAGCPAARIAPLFRTAGQALLRRVLELRPAAAHPRRHLVTPSLLRRLHGEGIRVHAWTANTAREARRLLRLGVDGIFTDDPARLIRLRSDEAKRQAEKLRRAASPGRRPGRPPGPDAGGAAAPAGRAGSRRRP